jgi:hypothetical protein
MEEVTHMQRAIRIFAAACVAAIVTVFVVPASAPSASSPAYHACPPIC